MTQEIDDVYNALEGKKLEKYSLVRAVYFLCLSKPRSQQELSQIIYDGKIQLSRINEAIDILESAGYIRRVYKTRAEMRSMGISTKANIWESTTKPILMYFNYHYFTVRGSSLEVKDLEAMDAILSSKWFKETFLNGEFPWFMLGRGTDVMGNLNMFSGEISKMHTRYLEEALQKAASLKEALGSFKEMEYGNFVRSLNLDKYKSTVIYTSLGAIANNFADFVAPKAVLPESISTYIDEALGISRTAILQEGFDAFINSRKNKFSNEFIHKVEKIKQQIYEYFGQDESISFYFKDNVTYLLPYDLAKKALYVGKPSSIIFPLRRSTEKAFENVKKKDRLLKL